jgi:hypothetical protein
MTPKTRPRWEAATLAALLLLAAGFVGYFLGARSQARSDRRAAYVAPRNPLQGIRLSDVRILPSERDARAIAGLASFPEGQPLTKAPRTLVTLQWVDLPGVRDKVYEDAQSRLREGGVLMALPPLDPDGYLAHKVGRYLKPLHSRFRRAEAELAFTRLAGSVRISTSVPSATTLRKEVTRYGPRD